MELDPQDLRIETFNTGGGWIHNPNGVRVTHIPSGISHKCGSERSQHRNLQYALEELKKLVADWTPPPPPHPDDLAVDKFAEMMKAKLAKSREKGRSGWDDPERCSERFLAKLLVKHVEKGDPVDVANLAMMLALRGADHNILKNEFAIRIHNEIDTFARSVLV